VNVLQIVKTWCNDVHWLVIVIGHSTVNWSLLASVSCISVGRQ
jgi:hypothetical protein